jgi:hypothetical protein
VRSFDPVRGVFVGAHRGYLRFAPGVLVVRTIELDGERHRLTIRDEFEGDGDHEISLLLQLSDRAAIERVDEASMRLAVDGRAFLVSSGDPTDWEVTVDTGWISPSYGIKNEAPCLRWHRSGQLRPLRVEVAPAE